MAIQFDLCSDLSLRPGSTAYQSSLQGHRLCLVSQLRKKHRFLGQDHSDFNFYGNISSIMKPLAKYALLQKNVDHNIQNISFSTVETINIGCECFKQKYSFTTAFMTTVIIFQIFIN